MYIIGFFKGLPRERRSFEIYDKRVDITISFLLQKAGCQIRF